MRGLLVPSRPHDRRRSFQIQRDPQPREHEHRTAVPGVQEADGLGNGQLLIGEDQVASPDGL